MNPPPNLAFLELETGQLATEPGSPSNASAQQKEQSHWLAILSHLKTEISLEHADIPIIVCCLVSGLCDSSAYNAWSCFVSMQTGKPVL